ncbi:hypothetical protein [Sphingomonas sediminicola]|uniref:hypothetical protein n=1 Tax=Sphingomonas sediminicola TaxID=386874 RepID=UPI001CA77E79|nr:hypothetical protein [Sphingomonas sediminicola]
MREFGRDRPAPDLPASTPLTLVINANLDGKAVARWEDNKGKDLESMIAPIVASIVVAGEANFRRGLRQAEEWAEQSRQWEEQRRREQVEARNRERLGRLRESAELLRQAEELRALVARVRDAVVAGSVGIHQASLAAWEEWASAEADRLDPVLSGQVLTHLEET